MLWPVVESEFVGAAGSDGAAAEFPATGDPADELSSFVPQLLRLRAPAVTQAWRAPSLPAPVTDHREDTADPLAAAVGTLAHAVLELIAADPEGWSALRVTERQPGFERWLASRGWLPGDARAGASRVARMLGTTLASPDGLWVLSRRPGAAAELALTGVGASGTADALCVPGAPLRGQVTRVVDRSFIEDGVRWIIDYKTADMGDTADILRLTDHAGRYRSQLESYAALFAAEGLPQRLAVFYVAHGILVTLEYNSVFG